MLPYVLIAMALVSVVLLVRRSQQHERKATAAEPGGCRDRAILVARFDELDAAVRQARCSCGAPLRTVGEGSDQAGWRRYRFVRCECANCGAEQRIWFDVTGALG